MSASNSEKALHQSRTFGSCITCRLRKVKCDQVRPTCLTCRAVGAKCEGYQARLKWITNGNVSRGNDSTNRENALPSARSHLYSEASRASMSQALQSDLASRSIDQTLLEIDAQRMESIARVDQGIVIGPFGVFHLLQPSRDGQAVDLQTTGELQDPSSATDVLDEGNDFPLNIGSVVSFDNTNDLLDWGDLFQLDMAAPGDDLQNADSQFASSSNFDPFLDEISVVQQSGFANCSTSTQPEVATSAPLLNSPVSARPSNNEGADNLSSSDAQLLLKHFRDYVIPQMWTTPDPKRSPWEFLNLDFAILTLARITFMASQNVSSAALCNLFAIVALAAEHLNTQQTHKTHQSTNREKNWQIYASNAIEKAKEYLKTSLRHETHGSGAAKYKHQVMAISSMLAFSILFDKQQDARAYMVDAERLLRHRGLAKRHISQKARLLHHVYTWTRIVDESTYVLRDYRHERFQASSVGHEPRTISYASHLITTDSRQAQHSKLDNFLRLEQNPESDTESATAIRKEHESGLRDIHLEDSRQWEGFFVQLYGVSETWLSLLSQTTRLANVLDSCKATKEDMSADLLAFLERRKSRLENKICAFASSSWQGHQHQTRGATDGDMDHPQASMVRALNCALTIFFYRRAGNVNAWILQDHVYEVINALKNFEASCQSRGLSGPGSPWPAFMAGSEALRQDQRDYFLGWFDRAFELTGFPRLISAKSCIQEVWNRRDMSIKHHRSGSGSQIWTWTDVCKEKSLHVLLS